MDAVSERQARERTHKHDGLLPKWLEVQAYQWYVEKVCRNETSRQQWLSTNLGSTPSEGPILVMPEGLCGLKEGQLQATSSKPNLQVSNFFLPLLRRFLISWSSQINHSWLGFLGANME